MMNSLLPHSTFFDTYEAREEAFRRLVNFKLARRYAGPTLFWKDFGRISRSLASTQTITAVAHMSSNPRDCLAFATPRQVLLAALMTAGKPGSEATILKTAARFGIVDQLSQPIRTLSGGETVKLALAKTLINTAVCSRVVISSPFSWLSVGNRHLLDILVARCRKRGKPLSLLALEGEDDLSPIGSRDLINVPDLRGPTFVLRMDRVHVPLTLSLNPLTAGRHHATVDNTELTLQSPCVVTGDNGQGKSLVARILAGALPTQGMAEIEGPAGRGKAGLLFQDVLTQTLLRSFGTLAGGRRGVARSSVLAVYQTIRDAYRACRATDKGHTDDQINDPGSTDHTLLDVKAILVAVRLSTKPAALILDEPDWGLKRTSAIAFVSAVLAVARAQGIPVVLISHKPWWRAIAGSLVSVSRTAASDTRPSNRVAFKVSLQPSAGVS